MGLQSSDFQGYEEILRQHRELKELLARIDSLLAKPTGAGTVVAELLATLPGQLAGHFAFEESEEYFGEALQHAPHLASQATVLLAQHAEICSAAEAIAQAAASSLASPDTWERTAAEYRALQQRLLQHEREEDTLLFEAYGQDLGSHD
jgi:hypothetical protein